MSGNEYAILGYVISAVLLGGYAMHLWMVGRRLDKLEARGSDEGLAGARNS